MDNEPGLFDPVEEEAFDDAFDRYMIESMREVDSYLEVQPRRGGILLWLKSLFCNK